MREFLIAIIGILVLNSFVFLVNTAIEPYHTNIYLYNSSLDGFNDGNYVLEEFDENSFPATSPSVSEQGNYFTDGLNSIKEWIFNIPGLRIITDLVNAIPNFLKMMGIDKEISFALGYIAQVVGIILIVMWWKQ